MYLPLLGLDLRENFRKVLKPKTFLSPSAQAFLLYVLYHTEKIQFSPKETAIIMGYTSMTMTRSAWQRIVGACKTFYEIADQKENIAL